MLFNILDFDLILVVGKIESLLSHLFVSFLVISTLSCVALAAETSEESIQGNETLVEVGVTRYSGYA